MIKVLAIFLTIFTFCAALENGLVKTPPMAWNSWNHFRCDISEELIKQTAHALIDSGLAAKGYVYVNLDDCWQMDRDENGKIVVDKDRFPSGMKALADYVHGLGLKIGLYSDAGIMTCERRPGSLGYEEIDAQIYAEWEIDYLKYDNCYNTGVPGLERYTKMRNALLNSGRDIVFSMCSWGEEEVWTWGAEVGNAWRTTADIEDKWSSFIDLLDKQVGLEVYSRPGAWNDPDMLEVGNGGMTDSEYEAHFALWALLKSPLIIGCDVRNMSESTLRILSDDTWIKVNQDPLGKQGRRVKQLKTETGALDTWVGEVVDGTVVILFNRSDNKEFMTAAFKQAGYDLPIAYVQDLTMKKQVGMVENFITTEVEPHSIRAFKISKECNDCSATNENIQI